MNGRDPSLMLSSHVFLGLPRLPFPSISPRKNSGLFRVCSNVRSLEAMSQSHRRTRPLDKGPFKCYVTQWGGGRGCQFLGKMRYEGVPFNVISVTRFWVGVKFPGKVLRNT